MRKCYTANTDEDPLYPPMFIISVPFSSTDIISFDITHNPILLLYILHYSNAFYSSMRFFKECGS